MSQTEQRLAELGIELPSAPAPAGNYLACMEVGSLLYLSGAICLVDGAMTHTGKVGESRDVAYGQAAARVCALNLLAVAKGHLSDLDRVQRVVQLNGFVPYSLNIKQLFSHLFQFYNVLNNRVLVSLDSRKSQL